MVASSTIAASPPRVASLPHGVAAEVQVARSMGAVSEAEWMDLWRRDPRANVYQSYPWYTAWERHLLPAQRAEFRLILVRAGGRLMAACPLAIVPRWHEGVHRGRVLTFASALSPAYPLDQGPLVEPACRPAMLAVLAQTIAGQRGYDFILFELFEPGSSAAELLEALGEATGQRPVSEPQTESHLVELAPTWDGFLEGLGARTRRNIRAYGKKFHEVAGRELVAAAHSEEFMALIDAFAAQKSRRFADEGSRSNFDEAALTHFLKEAGAALLERGMLLALMARLPIETASDVEAESLAAHVGASWIAATQLVLHDPHGHIYSYNSSFDLREKELRLHYLLESERIKRAIELGYSRLDLSTGHAEHKQHWTGGKARQLNQGWLAVTLRGRLLYALLKQARAWRAAWLARKEARQQAATAPPTPAPANAPAAAPPSPTGGGDA